MHKKDITLIVKIGALGDVVRTSFLAQAIKEKTGNTVVWLTSSAARPLFINNPYVDSIITLENKDVLYDMEFDEIINLEEDESLCRFICELKRNSIKGFFHDGDRVAPTETAIEVFNMSYIGPRPMNDVLKINNTKTHRQLVGEIAEVDWERYEPFIKLNNKQLNIRDAFSKRHCMKSDDFVVGINSGGADTWPKALPIRKAVELIDRIYNKYKCHILLFGGPSEIGRNSKICAMSSSPIINTGCGNDLIEFPALVDLCNIFISTDSLGLHIALGLKVKTVAMIGPTSVSEIGMYNIGEKIVAKSNQVCTYSKNKDKDIMNKIDIEEVIGAICRLRKQTISLVITSFNDKNLRRAIKSAINQDTRYKYNVIVVSPNNNDLAMAKKMGAMPFKDPGKGKSFALNKVFNKIKSDILILTDGDVYICDDAVEEIVNKFSYNKIGCVSGRPVPVENNSTKYGYWANVLFDAAHNLRSKAFVNNEFIECSGYLFAFRGGHIKQIPLDVAEDTYIPYFFANRGYKIGYAEDAMVYVKNVDNFKDWVLQKVRTSKAHETLDKYVDTKYNKKVKSFLVEAKGLPMILKGVDSPKKLYWTMQLVLARGYMWAKVKADTKIAGRHYSDGWETPQSTK